MGRVQNMNNGIRKYVAEMKMCPTLQKAVVHGYAPLPQQQTSHTEQCYRQCKTALQTPSCLSHIFRVLFHFWCWQYQSSSKVLGSEHRANYMTSGHLLGLPVPLPVVTLTLKTSEKQTEKMRRGKMSTCKIISVLGVVSSLPLYCWCC